MAEDQPVTAERVRVGVELFTEDLPGPARSYPGRPGADSTEKDVEDFQDATGRWRSRALPQKVVEYGHDCIEAAARVVGEQVSTVIRETLVGMDRAPLPQATATGLVTSSVQLTFGLKLTVGAGKAIEAVMSAGGEASVQVALTLTRPSQPGA